jgi:hypothetical protein
MTDNSSDPFDDLLGLEEKFYDEGYQLGITEGEKAGRIEGRVFGLEKGFEKYMEAGRQHGRSMVWAGRFPYDKRSSSEASSPATEASTPSPAPTASQTTLPLLSNNPRLEKHIRTLYALTEPASLSTDNSEEAVSDFDDRLKRAQAKTKIIERLVQEDPKLLEPAVDKNSLGTEVKLGGTSKSADQNIEDVDILKARH